MNSITAQSVFGANPWRMDAMGTNPNGTTFPYNPYYFATPEAAEILARMVGGKVAEEYSLVGSPGAGPFSQNYPNLMIEFVNGGRINAGLLMTFWNHYWNQEYINQGLESSIKDVYPMWEPVQGKA
jgi:hypothetical protein